MWQLRNKVRHLELCFSREGGVKAGAIWISKKLGLFELTRLQRAHGMKLACSAATGPSDSAVPEDHLGSTHLVV